MNLKEEIDKLGEEMISHGEQEEFHHKHPEGNSYMRFWHKNERLKIEAKLRPLQEAFDIQRKSVSA